MTSAQVPSPRRSLIRRSYLAQRSLRRRSLKRFFSWARVFSSQLLRPRLPNIRFTNSIAFVL